MSKSKAPSQAPGPGPSKPAPPNETEKAVKKSFNAIMFEIQNIHKLANTGSGSVRTSYRNKFKKAITDELSTALDRLSGKNTELF